MDLSVETIILYILRRVASGERIRRGRYDDERVDPTESRRNASEVVRDLSRDPEVCVFSQILETIDFRSSRHSIFRPYRAHDRGRRLLKRSAVVCVYSGNLNNGISARFLVTSDTTRRGGKFFSSYRIILHADAK